MFSVLSWLIFAVLLLGRARFGWRGWRAVRLLFTGAGLLLLAYVGSRFVLEIILGPPDLMKFLLILAVVLLASGCGARAGVTSRVASPSTHRPPPPAPGDGALRTCAACICRAAMPSWAGRACTAARSTGSARSPECRHATALQSWFGPSLLDERPEAPEDQQEFGRLWRGFMTARVTLGLVLLLLQGTLYVLGQTGQSLAGADLRRLFRRRADGARARPIRADWGRTLTCNGSPPSASTCWSSRPCKCCTAAASTTRPLFALPMLHGLHSGLAAAGHGHGGRRDPAAVGLCHLDVRSSPGRDGAPIFSRRR